MKLLRWSVLSLALFGVASVYAEDKKADEKKPAARQRPERRPGTGAFQPGRQGNVPLLSEKDIEELKLTAEQKTKVEKIVKSYEVKAKEASEKSRKAFEDLRAGGNRPDMAKIQEIFAAGRKVRTEAEDALKAVLTEDQKKKFEDLRRNRGGRGAFGRGGFGAPFTPGTVLPGAMKDRLELTADQKKQIEELEKSVKEKLNKILTEDQKKKLEQGPGRGGPGGNRPGGQPRRPRTDQ